MRQLSIIVPIYNEEQSIKDTVELLKQLLDASPDFELILVNDGSTDGTADLLTGIQQENIKVLTHTFNKGYGAAIKTAVKHAQADYIAITDADNSYPSQQIPELFKKTLENSYAMVVGARTGRIDEVHIMRKIVKCLLRKLAEYLTNQHIPDLNSGLRIIKKEYIMKFISFLPDGFSFTTTITLALLSNNYDIAFVPINYYKRAGYSKIRPVRDTLNFFQLIIRTVMFFNPLKVFLPSGILFIFLSFTVLVVTYYLGRVMDITTIILFTTGINILFFGLLADLVVKRINQ